MTRLSPTIKITATKIVFIIIPQFLVVNLKSSITDSSSHLNVALIHVANFAYFATAKVKITIASTTRVDARTVSM